MLMALLVLIGQLVTGIKPRQAIANMLKAYIGYAVFSVGTGGISSALTPAVNAIRASFKNGIVYSEMYFGLGLGKALMEQAGIAASVSSAAMVGSFLVELFLALPGVKRITKIRTLLVQGHIMNNHSWCIALALFMCFPQLTYMQIVIMSSLMGGIKFAVLSNTTVEAAQTLTDGAGMCVGHAQMLCDWMAFRIGEGIEFRARKKGKEVKNLDNIKLPAIMDQLSDIYLSSFIVVFLFFGGMMLAVGKEAMMAQDSSLTEKTSFFYYIFTTTAKFPVYLCIVQTGLRMFIAEMIVAFTGISEKLLKNSLPGIDVAAFYGFAPNANCLTVGFLVGTTAMILTSFGMWAIGLPFAVFTAFMSMFFDNASVGMFGYLKGGLKGCVISALLTGFINIFFGGLGAYILGYIAMGGVPGSNTDFSILHTFWGVLWKGIGMPGFWLSCIIMLALPQIQYLKNKDTYWLAVEDWEKYKEVKEAKIEARLAACKQ